MKIFVEERLEKILEIVNKNGRVTVPELAKIFNISDITIRRDLEKLENKGYIKRTHGGALKNLKTAEELEYEEQMELKIDEKKKIAKFALDLIENNDSIIIEASTTNICFSEYIVEFLKDIKITIFTNSPAIISNLRKTNQKIEVFCSGGKLKKDTNSFVGFDAINFFKNINVDKAFISIGAVDNENIMTISSQEELEVKKSIISSSKKIIALSDSSKFNNKLLYKIDSIKIVDILVTDKSIDNKTLNRFLKLGIKVFTV